MSSPAPYQIHSMCSVDASAGNVFLNQSGQYTSVATTGTGVFVLTFDADSLLAAAQSIDIATCIDATDNGFVTVIKTSASVRTCNVVDDTATPALADLDFNHVAFRLPQ